MSAVSKHGGTPRGTHAWNIKVHHDQRITGIKDLLGIQAVQGLTGVVAYRTSNGTRQSPVGNSLPSCLCNPIELPGSFEKG